MTPDQEKEFLDLLPNDRLYRALFDRFDHAVFYGIKARPEEDAPNQKITSMRYKGNMFVCQGIACRILRVLGDEYETEEEEISGDEL